MGNTVGSFAEVSKFWQKKWISIKDSLVLTQEQKSVLIGSILGDGTLQLGERGANANFKTEHGLVQKEYVYWKYNIFKPWVFTEPKISYRYKESRERYAKSYWFRTVRHPTLTEFHKRFYENGKKMIPKDIAGDIDALALAVWVMDDGSLNSNQLDISTYSFTLQDIYLLIDALKSNFGLSSKYYRDRDKGYRMYFNKTETRKLISLIKPHVIPNIDYKIRIQQ
ncbi:MAG: LAGLIDADG homing endonuclease [Candidatus Collierbacteria bacterium GW2011_GWA2_46_26]|uniref:LAGLIDADG homing endonuclease n=1 Tax=Candidatus Collierbacteria bacterium GW2011_GWA2_46_26 TaxID=1618381 RepID=A0A0G1PHL2_9BACT|nr:MAG: LAGLIDADG homing endonuclease [Candidatus Collierbacteria bacterium GW2011_GWA2_46_26]